VAGTPYDFTTPRPIGGTAINNPYTGLRRDDAGRAWLRLSGGGHEVALWVDEGHPWLEVYTADEADGAMRRAGIGAEPMTCPPNAFVTGTDLITLEPGAEFAARWGVTTG
jgi:aldose 1-epimerase